MSQSPIVEAESQITAEQESTIAAERKAIYAAVAILQACHEFEEAMAELGEQSPDSLVLDFLAPMSRAAQEMTAAFEGNDSPITAAMYQTGDLVRLES